MWIQENYNFVYSLIIVIIIFELNILSPARSAGNYTFLRVLKFKCEYLCVPAIGQSGMYSHGKWLCVCFFVLNIVWQGCNIIHYVCMYVCTYMYVRVCM